MLLQTALLITALTVIQAFDFERNEKHVELSVAGPRWSRIVSGWTAQPGQHPHQAVIRMVNTEGRVGTCGACIVHSEWLLTAAHCTAGKRTIVVRAGLIDIHRPEMMLETTEHYIYNTYDISRPASVQRNDISMVKLQQPLKFSKNLRAIRIQPAVEANRSYEGETLIVSGFGRTWTNGNRTSILKWVYLRGITNENCTSTFSSNYISENNICAIYYNETSQSICQGDNGGPLVHVSPQGQPTLIGISSFVAGNEKGCHSGYPSVFTRTGPFHSWFKDISGIDFDKDLPDANNNESTTIYSTTEPLTTYPTDPVTTSPTIIPTSTLSTDDPSTASPSTNASSPTSVTPTPSISSSTVWRNTDVNNLEVQKAMEVDIRVNVKLNKEEKKELSSDNKE